MSRSLPPALAVAALTLVAACADPPTTPSSSFSSPIDFAYACEGDGATVAPMNDETARALNSTRMCADVDQTPLGGAARVAQGDLFGVVLNRHPAGLVVLQMNPATGERRVIDSDPFVPGFTPIPVGRQPIRVLRADDYSAFYVVSAGDRSVTRVVLERYVSGILDYDAERFALPGIPAAALMHQGRLVIAAAEAPVLWLYDLTSGEWPAAPVTVAVPGHARELVALGDDLLVTWVDRTVVTRLTAEGAVRAEAGLVAACRDGLDNDGDGLVDGDDPDCRDPDDDDESDATGVERPAGAPSGAPSFGGAPLCANGVDDDGDGFTDFPDDPACASADDDGEGLPACSDGVDNDGDGLFDHDGGGDPALADPSCYGPEGRVERRLPAPGPFSAAVVDAGEYGTFVYVLDAAAGSVRVFEPQGDGALARVDVNATDVALPALESVPYGDPSGAVEERDALRVTRLPALQRQRERDILLDGPSAVSLSAGRLRGELWERLIAPAPGEAPAVSLSAPDALWTPARCAPGRTDACYQPELDDASWYVYAPRLDGRIVQIEAIRRGVPVHRVAQRQIDPANRGTSMTAPRLTVRGRFIVGRGEPQEALPFIGAGIEELLEEAVSGESPPRLRRFGVWPAADLEQVPTESWTITYEGRIPGASGALGRMTGDATLYDPSARFCEAGVAVGDLVALEMPTANAAPALHHTVDVVTELGDLCPTLAPHAMVVEARVTRVGMVELEVDPATARLRPTLPALDESAITAAGVSLRACEQALSDLELRLGLPEHLVDTDAWAAAALPSRFSYAARVGDAWAIVGSVSGFLHRQRWDRDAEACVTDESLDPRLTGRHAEASVDPSSYGSCPPTADQLRFDTVTALTPADARFENPSFAVDIFPGCERLESNAVALVPSQQDTTWSFTLTGPHEPTTLAVSNSELGVAAPPLDFRRQVLQLDAAANRASLLQVRPDSPSIIAIFE